MTDENTYWELVEHADRMLAAERSTLWGRSWDLSQRESRAEAAHWLVRQIENLHDWIED